MQFRNGPKMLARWLVNRRSTVVGVALALIAGVLVHLLHTPSTPTDALVILADTTSRSGISNLMVISNRSNVPVVFLSTKLGPDFLLSYSVGGEWISVSSPITTRGPFMLGPHQAVTSRIEVPTQATRWKVGLEYFRLSRLGRLAWKLQGTSVGDSLRPIVERLFAIDSSKATEAWSRVYD